MNKPIILSLIAIVFLAAIGLYVFNSSQTVTDNPPITNFEECAEAGYAVMESYPRQCRSGSGELFVEDISDSNPEVVGTGGCYVGGCSSQICSEDKDAVSTCEYKEEYACYKAAKCERQTSGQCGWT